MPLLFFGVRESQARLNFKSNLNSCAYMFATFGIVMHHNKSELATTLRGPISQNSTDFFCALNSAIDCSAKKTTREPFSLGKWSPQIWSPILTSLGHILCNRTKIGPLGREKCNRLRPFIRSKMRQFLKDTSKDAFRFSQMGPHGRAGPFWSLERVQ